MIRHVMAPVTAIQRARNSVRRAAVRRSLEGVASGKSDHVSLNFDDHGVDVAGVIEEITTGLPADSIQVRRLVAVLKNSGAVDDMVERLDAHDLHQRSAAARAIGALHLHEAVSRVAPLLGSRQRPVSDASARALGKIGGADSAAAVLNAIQRRGLSRRLVAELARSAPDLFLESALGEPQKPGLRPALALAAGLRRRRTATNQLIALVQRGSRREKVISCRALGWIGAKTAIPVITAALMDRDWRTRMSAAKALGALGARSSTQHLSYLVADRNPRVRKAARMAISRMEARPTIAGAA